DRHQYICFALTLWNGRDPILKERFFGLTGNEGNHGEDLKEYYFYLDSTPSHSYMKFLYKYPYEYPYSRIVEENRRRSRQDPEYELIDTGAFNENRYFDIFVEYAKATPEDILIRIEAINRGPETAHLEMLPTVWFRNTWASGLDSRKPNLKKMDRHPEGQMIRLNHSYYGYRWLCCEGDPELLFTDNETNAMRLWGIENDTRYVKDAFDEYLIRGKKEAINPAGIGTKAAARYSFDLASGQRKVVHLRLTDVDPDPAKPLF